MVKQHRKKNMLVGSLTCKFCGLYHCYKVSSIIMNGLIYLVCYDVNDLESVFSTVLWQS